MPSMYRVVLVESSRHISDRSGREDESMNLKEGRSGNDSEESYPDAVDAYVRIG